MDTFVVNPQTASAKVNPNGRILIPAALREQMGIQVGDSVTMEVEDGVLRVESYRARIRRIQQEFAQYKKPGLLASDELVAERRDEARREEEEIVRDQESSRLRLQKAEQIA
jgi:AbrB family looped-hinge helix DNA binding protein